MIILAVNCGSSSLKFQLFACGAAGAAAAGPRRLKHGMVDRIGNDQSVLKMEPVDGPGERESVNAADHDAAMGLVLDALRNDPRTDFGDLAAVGHRVVHGGDVFAGPARIDDRTIQEIERLVELAPLHNGPALQAIRAAGRALRSRVPQAAVFDTAFHSRMPPHAAQYAIPAHIARAHGIRRYGFHGLAHQSMVQQYASIVDRPLEALHLITLQLGNGCSAAAVAHGRSVDTTMGFTPLEGLMMGTRSGDLDPTLPGFIARRRNVPVEQVESWLNTRSGLLGVSGRSSDMRDLLESERVGDTAAALAVDMFCHRARKAAGAFLAVLGGADAIVFGGGIGENAPSIRQRICTDMGWCGLKLDAERNAAAIGVEARISTDVSTLAAHVVPVDEAEVIARDTCDMLFGTDAQRR